MLKKVYAFGLLAAAVAIAPGAAFAGDQVSASNTTINQTSLMSGHGNVSGQSVDAKTIQTQIRNGSWFCNSGNQVAGSNTVAGQGSAIAGIGNVNAQAGSSTTVQTQVAGGCVVPYYRLRY